MSRSSDKKTGKPRRFSRQTASFKNTVERGAACFNRRRYIEAHEIWEDLWRNARGEDRLILQGLIQAAVGWAHFQKGNLRGAVALFKHALRKFSHHKTSFCGINLKRLVEDLQKSIQELEDSSVSSSNLVLPQLQRTRSTHHPI